MTETCKCSSIFSLHCIFVHYVNTSSFIERFYDNILIALEVFESRFLGRVKFVPLEWVFGQDSVAFLIKSVSSFRV